VEERLMVQQSVHHAARLNRGNGAGYEVARPAQFTSRRQQRRRERACRKTIGHCWHPASGMGVDWWCCECSGETDGNPPNRCAQCWPDGYTGEPAGERLRPGRRIPPSQDGPVALLAPPRGEWVPPTQDMPHQPPPAAGPTRVQVQHVGEPAAERMIRRPGQVASDHHVAQLCAVAEARPRPDHSNDPERALAGWKANMRLYADQIAAEAWHAGATWGVARQTGARYVVVTEQEYERLRAAAEPDPDGGAVLTTEAVADWVRRVAAAEEHAIASAVERATQLGVGVRVRRTPDRLIVNVDPDVPVGEVHVHQGFPP
jgi:hypothetical protein